MCYYYCQIYIFHKYPFADNSRRARAYRYSRILVFSDSYVCKRTTYLTLTSRIYDRLNLAKLLYLCGNKVP